MFDINEPGGLADRWGTPLYVVSLDQLEANVETFQAGLPEARLLYSLKTNYLPAVTRRVRELGLGVDVVSGYELRAALDSGFTGDRIVFNGPVKQAGELAAAVGHGVFVNVDGFEEVAALAALAARRNTTVPVGLRVYPAGDVYADDPATPRAVPSKFGWPLADGVADQVADQILSRPELRLTGVHCHLGSQITRARALLHVLEPVLDWAAKLRARAPLERLNLGGGFGVPGIERLKGVTAGLSSVQSVTASGPQLSFDLAGFSAGLRALLAERGLADLELYAEPGRSLVSSAAVLLTRVASIKPLPGQTWVLLDGGLNLLPTAGVAERHGFTALRAAGDEASYLVGGPLCYEGDVFATDARLPADLRLGDLVAVEDAGAYGFSRATSFNRLRPATVVLDHGSAALAWRAETYEDLMRMSVS